MGGKFNLVEKTPLTYYFKIHTLFIFLGAPRRMLTTWDVIGDLPAIESGNKNDSMNYNDDLELPLSKLYFR